MGKIGTIFLNILIISAFLLPCAAGCAGDPAEPSRKDPEVEEGAAIDVSDGTARLFWAERTGAEGYNVYRSKSTFGEREQVATSLTERRYETQEHLYDVYTVTAVADGKEEEIGRTSVFSENTLIVAPTDDMRTVQTYLDERHSRLETADHGQFSSERLAVFLLPGEYDLDIKLGYYTTVSGLGRTPYDVRVKKLSVSTNVLANNNATCTFWRGAENLTVAGDVLWAVSQATSLRRMCIEGDLSLSYQSGWSSGGFLADSEVLGTVYPGTQQQWMSRNDRWNKWDHCTSHNYVFSGCEGSIPQGEWTEQGMRSTVLPATERMAEKPYLVYDETNGYRVFVPDVRENAAGLSWQTETGQFLSLDDFLVASEEDGAEELNRALGKGKHLYFPAGHYRLERPIEVEWPETVLLGSGYGTLEITEQNKDCALRIADVDGVRVAGLLVDAGSYSKNMVVVGEEGKHTPKIAPVVLSDLYLRIGGVKNVHTETDVALAIHADGTLGDNFWIWRADHSQGVGWEDVSYENEEGTLVTEYGNPVKTGLLVTGDDVSCYALMVEHCEGYQTDWRGERGLTVMYQSETPYRVPAQDKWMSGDKNGCASYKVGENVKAHRAYGIGIYLVNYSSVNLASAIETPAGAGIAMEHLVICAFTQNASSISNVINDYGGGVGANAFRRLVAKYPL